MIKNMILKHSREHFLKGFIRILGNAINVLYPIDKLSDIQAKVLALLYLDVRQGYVIYRGDNYIKDSAKLLDIKVTSLRQVISALALKKVINRVKYGIYELNREFEINVVEEFDQKIIVIQRTDSNSDEHPTISYVLTDKMIRPNKEIEDIFDITLTNDE